MKRSNSNDSGSLGEEEAETLLSDEPKPKTKTSKTTRGRLVLQIEPDESDVPTEAPSAIDQASWWSKAYFGWVTPLVKLARKRTINMEDLWTLSYYDRSEIAVERLSQEWDIEVAKSKASEGSEKPYEASPLMAALRTYKRQFIIIEIFMLAWLIFAFLGACFFIRFLLSFVQDATMPVWQGVLVAIGFFFNETARSLCLSMHWYFATVTASRLRTGVFGLVYRKILRLRSTGDQSVGALVNIVSNDNQRFFDAINFGSFLFISVGAAIITVIYATIYIGPYALTGVGVYLLYFPAQALLARYIAFLRRGAIKITDKRVRQMFELITGIKFVKMYAWEKSFSEKINGVRQAECKYLQKSGLVQSVSWAVTPMVPALAAFITFSLHSGLGHEPLSPAQAFTLLGLFIVLRFPLNVLPNAVKSISEARVGMTRLKKLLLTEEVTPLDGIPDSPHIAVELRGTFSWLAAPASAVGTISKPPKTSKHGIELLELDSLEPVPTHRHELEDVSLVLPKGQLLGVCGPVGCGKSSLVAAMLGQLLYANSNCSVKVDGGFAYVPQQPWVFNASLRENILFGQRYEEAAYQRTINCCALQADIDMLPSGDATEIGERGINLSGGQKARVSLARAVYSNRDIFLLDDPLSAVDPHVGQHIFEQCISQTLKGKTRVFVTHQLQYLKHCDEVIFMENGRVIEQGTYTDLMAMPQGKLAQLISTHYSSSAEETGERTAKKPRDAGEKVALQPATALIAKEERVEGAVKASTYKTYMRYAGGYFLFITMLIVFFATMGFRQFIDYWLALWINAGCGVGCGNESTLEMQESYLFLNPDQDMYIMVYGCLNAGMIVLFLLRGLFFVGVTLKASTKLHNDVFLRVLRAPMYFFDTTPTGRILNRFSSDMDEIDVKLPFFGEQLLQNTTTIFLTIVVIASVFPWYLLCLIPLVAFFLYINNYFQACARDTKRLDNTTRSPLISGVGTTLNGLATIRAFGNSERLTEDYFKSINLNTRAFFAFYVTNRWLAFRLDLVTSAIVMVTGLFTVLSRGTVHPALSGLALTYAMQISSMFQYTVRLSAETTSRFTSVERISHYIANAPQEAAPHIEETCPESAWPRNGAIEFKDVEMRYREGLPLTLQGLSFKLDGNVKCGIVGRTGAGKSSLGVVLFRIVELASGTIKIDGVDISKLGLDDLRSRLAVVPQDPVLFVGTVRYNLDPFGNHGDEDLWQALNNSHIGEAIRKLPKGLDHEVEEGGSNFSVGERQLLCMARALLRHSKILLLDEATAAIDTETDHVIQETIRTAFNDCTLLIIAHRLNTILDCDKILVMDAGQAVEFGSPQELMKDTNSRFSSMVAAARMSGSTDH